MIIIYIYEADSGKLVRPPLSASSNSGFAFLDDDRLFYVAPGSAVLYSVRDGAEIWRLPFEGDSVAITVSGDGTKAAVLLHNGNMKTCCTLTRRITNIWERFCVRMNKRLCCTI